MNPHQPPHQIQPRPNRANLLQKPSTLLRRPPLQHRLEHRRRRIEVNHPTHQRHTRRPRKINNPTHSV
ncbi:MAG: hypothetical protein ACRDTT_01920, partial [Pseudonocardiaceae bacterium]